MSNNIHNPDELLGLQPLVEESIPLWEFLKSLKEHPERVDTASARLLRAIKDRGIVKPEDVEPSRRPYIQLMTDLKIPVYRAFDMVRGSQRFVQRFINHYESAAGGGYQGRQAMVWLSGPGAGKTMLGDAVSQLMEGADIWVVEGCPIGENPLNLLTLLSAEQLKKIGEALDLGTTVNEDGTSRDVFEQLLLTAQPPCDHCFKTIMGITGGDTVGTPNLSKVKVQRIRMSSRTQGVAVWSPPADGSVTAGDLHSALVHANRGVARLLEAFSANGVREGSVSELSLLLEATDSKRIPSGGSSATDLGHGWTHLDQNIIIESNPGAWKKFLESQLDRDAYVRRTRVLYMPYNTVVSEEEQAYKDALRSLKKRPEFDPLALRMMAFLAVASRMVNDQSKTSGIDLATRVRLYDGEPIVLSKTFSAIAEKPGIYDTYGSALSTGTGAKTDEVRTLTVEDIWRMAGDDEGKSGLNMGFMLAALSRVCEAVNSTPKKVGPALTVMGMLHQIIDMASKVPDISKEARDVYDRCKLFLKPLGAKTAASNDGESVIEAEYRRLLRNQFLSVFAPDYVSSATTLSDKYWEHALASAQAKEVFDPETKRKQAVDVPFLSKLETAMGMTGDEGSRFRASLVTEKADLIREQLKRDLNKGSSSEGPLKITWDLHPQIKKGISKILDEQIATKVSKLLTTEFGGLSAEEEKLRDESLERLKALGYSDATLKVALRYFKDNELWKNG